MSNDAASFVTIKSFTNYFPAAVLKSRLEADLGIPIFLKDEHTVTTTPFYGLAVGGIKLMVPRKFETQAKELLAEYEEQYLASFACPNCGSTEVSLQPSTTIVSKLQAILSFVFGDFAVGKTVYRCDNCN